MDKGSDRGLQPFAHCALVRVREQSTTKIQSVGLMCATSPGTSMQFTGMEAPAKSPQGRNLGSPDETRPFDERKMDVVTVGRAVFEPEWRWSERVKPIARTDSCRVAHVGYVVSGRMKVIMDDSSETEYGLDDAVVVPPGPDAWIVRAAPCTTSASREPASTPARGAGYLGR